jgi:hypothetical protein
MYIRKHLITSIIIMLITNCSFSQSAPKDTLLVLGEVDIDTSIVKISKSDFLKNGKIKTNFKGVSVNSYNFSMFALGNSLRCAVNDSMFTTKLREAVLNRDINYRFINIEGVTLIDRTGKITVPKIDTVKVKFKYQ